jgi:hypothetical protein
MYPAVTIIAQAERALNQAHESGEPVRRRQAEALVLAALAVADTANRKRLLSRKRSSFYLMAWRQFEQSQTAVDEENALLMLADAQVLATLALADEMGGGGSA